MRDTASVRTRLARIAWLLDSSIPLPGTRFSIGLDAIIGLVPGFGDLVGVLLSSYIVREAAQLGAPRSVLLRMAWNVAVEGVVGMVPLFGDVFDAAWKANQRNYRLLESYLDHPGRAVRSSRLFVSMLIAGLVLMILVLGSLSFVIVRAIAHAVSA